MFKKKPAGRSHNALVDCKVTLACYIEGSTETKWWYHGRAFLYFKLFVNKIHEFKCPIRIANCVRL